MTLLSCCVIFVFISKWSSECSYLWVFIFVRSTQRYHKYTIEYKLNSKCMRTQKSTFHVLQTPSATIKHHKNDLTIGTICTSDIMTYLPDHRVAIVTWITVRLNPFPLCFYIYPYLYRGKGAAWLWNEREWWVLVLPCEHVVVTDWSLAHHLRVPVGIRKVTGGYHNLPFASVLSFEACKFRLG